jgi:hypothetical protein
MSIALGGPWRIAAGLPVLVLLSTTIFRTAASRILLRRCPLLMRADWMPLLLFALTVTAYLRSLNAGQLAIGSVVSMTGVWSFWLLATLEFRRYSEFLGVMLASVVVYVAVNVLLALLQVPSPANPYAEAGPATVLAAIGLSVNRHLFPVALGINGFGIIAGLAVVIATVHALAARRRRTRWLLWAGVAALALLLSDSRGAMLAAVVSLALAVTLQTSARSALRRILPIGLPLAYLFGTIAVLAASSILSAILVAAGLERGGAPLSGRTIIWLAVLIREIQAGWSALLFGYGHLGQAISGASEGYVMLFSHLDVANAAQINVHSSLLQQLLDAGIAGVVLVAGIIRRLAQQGVTLSTASLEGQLVTATLSYGVIVGVVDLTFNPNNIVFFMLLFGLSLALNRRLENSGFVQS